MLNKVLLVFIEFALPLPDVLAEIDLLHGPERGLRLLVLTPDVGVLDGEEHVAVGVLPEQRFLGLVGELRSRGTLCGDRGHGLVVTLGLRFLGVGGGGGCRGGDTKRLGVLRTCDFLALRGDVGVRGVGGGSGHEKDSGKLKKKRKG